MIVFLIFVEVVVENPVAVHIVIVVAVVVQG